MDAELVEIRHFLAAHHPFDLLPADVLIDLARTIEITYVRRGTVVTEPGETCQSLYLIRKGAIETRDPADNNLLARLGEGEYCGAQALLRGGPILNLSRAIEDCLLYVLPAPLFHRLRREHKPFAYFFDAVQGGRLRDSLHSLPSGKPEDILTVRVRDMVSRRPVTIAADTTILEASRAMRQENVSCLLVTAGGDLAGIFTDRDLRTRVVAEGLGYDTPVGAVMSPDPAVIKATDFVFDALLAMSRRNVHHLPVVDGGDLVGCLTATDLINSHVTSPLYLVRDIHSRQSAEGLKQIVGRVPRLVRQMVEAGASAQRIGQIVTALTDAVTTRLLQLAEEALGPPPIPYVWVAAGSQARGEQTALSDQDSCMILDDAYYDRKHGEYFRALSRFVCTGLDTCGYRFCPGEMMAMTEQWRKPLRIWKDYFRRWIEEPDPRALLLSCIFFDLRPVFGDAALFDSLHDMILRKSQRNGIFRAHMAGNAMHHEPPIGFFRDFVLIRGGEHDHTLDLKHNGVVPIIDLARIYALTAGIPAANTFDRLAAAAEAKVVSHDGSLNMRDALEFIGMIRLRHQAKLICSGQPADNYVSPSMLSGFERNHLRSAFKVVKNMQAALAVAYHLDRF